jgi:hypothetical protein
VNQDWIKNMDEMVEEGTAKGRRGQSFERRLIRTTVQAMKALLGRGHLAASYRHLEVVLAMQEYDPLMVTGSLQVDRR